MAGKSVNSFGAKNWSPGSPSTRYNVSGKNREFYTFENAPGIGAYATGGTIIDGGDGYIYHIFTGGGTFTVNRPPAAIDSVEYLIVAGGGGCVSPSTSTGGGGGGGFLFGSTGVSNSPGSYPITVGAGGPSGPGSSGTLRSGSNSSAFGLTATGGGGGGGPNPGPPGSSPLVAGGPGGSGGGGGGSIYPQNPHGASGTGNSPPTIPRQGYSGGGGGAGGPGIGGAGGGSGGTGGLGSSSGPGRIAPEFPSTIVGKAIPAPVLPSWNPLVSSGGYSEGGRSGPAVSPARTTPANSGYGGQPSGAAGGSGIVCIRYKKTAAYSRATGGTIEPNTHPEHPGVWRHIFTSPGTFTVTDPSLQFINYLAVGGGGGGGTTYGGGGGGGGFASSIEIAGSAPEPTTYPWSPSVRAYVGAQFPVGSGSYPIVIGAGGPSNTSGSNTTIGSPGPTQIIAYGGGAGASEGNAGTPGGSGGGGSKLYSPTTPYGGGGVLLSGLQGNPGGSSGNLPTTNQAGGGGGAAATGGGSGSGLGGTGMYSVLSPSAYGTPGPIAGYRYFAGGGGGFNPAPTIAGGAGGGGAGTPAPAGVGTGTPGTVNTGGGGGGGGGIPINPPIPPTGGPGGTGGPGIVIIQYPE